MRYGKWERRSGSRPLAPDGWRSELGISYRRRHLRRVAADRCRKRVPCVTRREDGVARPAAAIESIVFPIRRDALAFRATLSALRMSDWYRTGRRFGGCAQHSINFVIM